MLAKYRILLFALLIAEMTQVVSLTMIYSAMPRLSRDFGGAANAGWIVTSTLLVSAMSAALGGRLGDLLGRKATLLAVLIITGVGSLISAFSGVLGGVIAGAALQGTAAAILPLCVSLVRQRMSPQEAPVAVGIILAAASAGAALSLIVGGVMLDAFGWSSIFLVSAGAAFLSALAVQLSISEPAVSRTQTQEVDLVRGVLFAPAIAGLLLLVTKVGEWGVSDPRTLTIGFISAAIMIYWARHQLGQKTPLIDLRLLANRQTSITYFCITVFSLGISQHTLLMMMLMQQPSSTLIGFGLGATFAGAALMCARIVGVVASPVSGWVCSRHTPRLALIGGAGMGLAGWSLIAIAPNNLPAVMLGMFIETWGFQMIYVAAPNAIIQVVPEDRTGEAVGIGQVFRMVGNAVGAQVVMLLLSSSKVSPPGQAGASYPAPDAYFLAFQYIIATALICIIAAVALPRRARLKAAA